LEKEYPKDRKAAFSWSAGLRAVQMSLHWSRSSVAFGLYG